MAQFNQKRRRFKFQQLGTHDFHWIFFYQLHQRKAGKRFQETDWEWIAFKKSNLSYGSDLFRTTPPPESNRRICIKIWMTDLKLKKNMSQTFFFSFFFISVTRLGDLLDFG